MCFAPVEGSYCWIGCDFVGCAGDWEFVCWAVDFGYSYFGVGRVFVGDFFVGFEEFQGRKVERFVDED